MLKKTLELSAFPLTEVKKSRLKDVFSKFRWCCSNLSDCIEYWDEITEEKPTSINLHHLTYKHHREGTGLPANIVQTARRQVYELRKSERVGNIPIRYDNRTFTFKNTVKDNPIITIATDNGRLPIPIIPNRLWFRFNEHLNNGWGCNSVMINFSNDNITVQPILTKEANLRTVYQTVLGVDVNIGNIAISVYDPFKDKPLRQLYFGQDVAGTIRDIGIRRSKLQSVKATKKLRKLKGCENNYVKTRYYQIAHKVVDLAKEYKSIIAIEDIKHIRDNTNLGRKTNRKFHRWAFDQFFTILTQIGNQEGVQVQAVNAEYTSQTCSKCGHISKANRRNWHLFKCQKCGFEVNPDRNASVNISKKLLSMRELQHSNQIVFSSQIIGSGFVVAQSVCSDEVVVSS